MPNTENAHPTMSAVITQDLAHDWINAWNTHDLERNLAHYEDAIVLISPVAQRILGGDGAISGKSAFRACFLRGLSAYSDLRFDLIDVLRGRETLVLYYGNNVRGNKTAEVMQISPTGKILRVWANYDRERSPHSQIRFARSDSQPPHPFALAFTLL